MGMATNTIALMTIIVCILSRNWLIEYLSMIILWLYYPFKVQKILTLVCYTCEESTDDMVEKNMLLIKF